MATLGKRKRISKAEVVTQDEGTEQNRSTSPPDLDAQEIFRRHFEAQFEPLPILRKPSIQETERAQEDDVDDESDWEGIEDNGGLAVQVVEHKEVRDREAKMSREELKAFMSSKPPSSTPKAALLPSNKTTPSSEADVSEAALLKNDLALQRLLSESHLLSSSISSSSTTLNLTGTNRHKATDLRLQALGSKKSLFAQEKMPLAHRRGMEVKKREREEKRRREARENGIILEKMHGGGKGMGRGSVAGKGRGGGEKRDRGLGKPGVGKFEGGVLRLSKKDVAEIQGDSGGGRSKVKGKRRG